MLVDSIRQTIICDELQFGQALNQSVVEGASARFNFLMSLLSVDVRDQPQFDMVAEEPTKANVNLRRQFQLADPQPIYMDTPTSESLKRWNNAADCGDLVGYRLEQCIDYEGLSPQMPKMDIPVLNNLSLLSRLKFQALHREADDAPKNKEAELPEESAMYHLLNDFDYEKPLSVHYYT